MSKHDKRQIIMLRGKIYTYSGSVSSSSIWNKCTSIFSSITATWKKKIAKENNQTWTNIGRRNEQKWHSVLKSSKLEKTWGNTGSFSTKCLSVDTARYLRVGCKKAKRYSQEDSQLIKRYFHKRSKAHLSRR